MAFESTVKLRHSGPVRPKDVGNAVRRARRVQKYKRTQDPRAGTNGWSGGEFCSALPIAESMPRRLVSANFENASRFRDFGPVRIFGHDEIGTGRAIALMDAENQLSIGVPPLTLKEKTTLDLAWS